MHRSPRDLRLLARQRAPALAGDADACEQRAGQELLAATNPVPTRAPSGAAGIRLRECGDQRGARPGAPGSRHDNVRDGGQAATEVAPPLAPLAQRERDAHRVAVGRGGRVASRSSASDSRLGCNAAVRHGSLKCSVVALVLVRVRLGERRPWRGRRRRRPEIGGDRDPVAERAWARASVQPQTRRTPPWRRVHRLDLGGALGVPELADVEVASARRRSCERSQPSMMSLAACISRCPSTTRCPCWSVLARAEERLEHRRLRLLDLEEERIGVVAAEQQHDPGRACRRCRRRRPCARRATSGSCSSRCGGRAAACAGTAEIMLPHDVLERARPRPVSEVLDRDDQRRIADDAGLAVDRST